MITKHHNRRLGITLTEVLIALFIMALGMIALLVMFPLGAQQIAQAVKDDRSTQAANNADNLLRSYWRKNVVRYLSTPGNTEADLVNPANPNSIDFMTAMEQPTVLPSLVDASFVTLQANGSRPSYPVFIDPYGKRARQTVLTSSFNWVGGVMPDAANSPYNFAPLTGTFGLIRRVNLRYPVIGTNVDDFRHCTLLDDIEFSEDGSAVNGSSVSRTGRYNWSWVVQRPDQNNRLLMNMTVIVYDQRSYNFAGIDEELHYFVPNVNVGDSTIVINYNPAAIPPAPAPPLRAGNWIMDGTINTANGIRNANFYRVSSVTDDGAGRLYIDLQTPIKRPLGSSITNYTAQIYVLRGVAEVFERRQFTIDDRPLLP
jgi:type II secretory pathway pseudopilin PulG